LIYQSDVCFQYIIAILLPKGKKAQKLMPFSESGHTILFRYTLSFHMKTLPIVQPRNLYDFEYPLDRELVIITFSAACKKGIESVRKNAPKAVLEDQTAEGFKTASNPKFELYRDKSGGYRFRLKSRNGKIIAASESYTSKAACENGIESVRKNAGSFCVHIAE